MKILIVSAQFPYPPRSGFATRVYQLSRQLAKRHEVTLLSYVWPHEREGVAALSNELTVRTIERAGMSPRAKRAAQAGSLFSSRPYYCRSVYSRRMQDEIVRLCRDETFDAIQLESSLLCIFSLPHNARIILDEHNVEYEVFRRMCETERSWPRRAFNRVEHARFRRFEHRWWRRIDGCIVTSEREVSAVRAHAPRTPLAVVPNAVDLEYFRPGPAEVQPFTVVFNGILTYRPNVDAALYLVEEVWPRVLRHCPHARLVLVGRNEGVDLRPLRGPGVVLIGEVPDIRDYLRPACAVAVPVRIGGGTRLKVVEAFAMGKAMVSTSLGCEGLEAVAGEHLLIADDADGFAARLLEVFNDPALRARLGRAGRSLVEREYSWNLAGERLEALYRRVVARDAGSGLEPQLLISPAAAPEH
jgi:glycosyltransferase involved in cell wall biosynthesis